MRNSGCGKITIARYCEKSLEKLGSVSRFTSNKLKPPIYKKFFQLLAENKEKYDFLIFDATFYKKEWREKLISLAENEKVVIVYVNYSLKTALERNKYRKTPIPDQAIKAISSKMEIPENPDVTIDTENLSIKKSVKKLLDFIQHQYS